MEKFNKWLENRQQENSTIDNMAKIPMALQYAGTPIKSNTQEILSALQTIGISIPDGISPERFVAMIKRIAADMTNDGSNWRNSILPPKNHDF